MCTSDYMTLIIHIRSHDHNNSPTPLLLTGWLLLVFVLFVSMVMTNNNKQLLVSYNALYSLAIANTLTGY